LALHPDETLRERSKQRKIKLRLMLIKLLNSMYNQAVTNPDCPTSKAACLNFCSQAEAKSAEKQIIF
jgi:hypothetical protein